MNHYKKITTSIIILSHGFEKNNELIVSLKERSENLVNKAKVDEKRKIFLVF